MYLARLEQPGEIQISLIGESLRSILGESIVGGNYLRTYNASERQRVIGYVQHMCDKSCGAAMVREVVYQERLYRASSLSFPLANEAGKPQSLIGIVDLDKSFVPSSAQSDMPTETIKYFKFIDLGFGT